MRKLTGLALFSIIFVSTGVLVSKKVFSGREDTSLADTYQSITQPNGSEVVSLVAGDSPNDPLQQAVGRETEGHEESLLPERVQAAAKNAPPLSFLVRQYQEMPLADLEKKLADSRKLMLSLDLEKKIEIGQISDPELVTFLAEMRNQSAINLSIAKKRLKAINEIGENL
jgi:hypothetical protein